ncbi:MAG: 23S rRNA (adenine(2030)-N(6))-methyltransferase RlmJ [Alphaproteobacteria bacterium]|nr:23S rRNA (adenine(2030)-N(6))-methyltransferase RlmJ [Alphaproteobacteria bacterium]MBV9062406.1 23S rRNA (adenine(2030)-N(6))-methyltransferase RlmJ [Alphaproteobacteria bacterium]
MNYRHAYHAGNFADVHKHVALVAIIQHIKKKDQPFAVVDAHAGRGLYDLAGTEASKTGEALDGIGLLRDHQPQSPAVAEYLTVAQAFGSNRYPGSPLIAASLLRKQDRLIAIENQPGEFSSLRQALAFYPNARAIEGDTALKLRGLLPPKERRGLILIDPPYEISQELEQISGIVGDALRRFATGIFVIWHPLKFTQPIATLCGELGHAGAARALHLAFDRGRQESDSERALSAAGLLVINPPFGFERTFGEAAQELLTVLRRGPGADARATWMRKD